MSISFTEGTGVIIIKEEIIEDDIREDEVPAPPPVNAGI